MIKKWQNKENPKGIRTSKDFAPIKKAIAQGSQQETVVETTSEAEQTQHPKQILPDKSSSSFYFALQNVTYDIAMII